MKLKLQSEIMYLLDQTQLFVPIIHDLEVEKRNSGIMQAKPVYIEDNVWIASNVVILPGVSIGEGAVIGAGSVVTKDVMPHTFVAGNPGSFYKGNLKIYVTPYLSIMHCYVYLLYSHYKFYPNIEPGNFLQLY